MSIATELNRIKAAKEAIKSAINTKGGTLTDELIDQYAGAIAALPSGSSIDLTGVTVTADGLLEGVVAVNGAGEKVTGNIKTVIAALSANVVTVPKGYIAEEQTLTVAEAKAPEVDGNVVTIYPGYVAIEQTVTVENSGSDVNWSEVTATASDIRQGTAIVTESGVLNGTLPTRLNSDVIVNGNQVAFPYGIYDSGYSVSVGTAKAAETITPGTVDQTIPADTYLSGDLTIKGDANLISENIVNGKTIFGVTGTHECIGSDGPVYDLSFVTAGEEDIREGKVGATTYGSPVYGTLKVDAVSSDVEYGYIDENGMFQKLDLSGDAPVNIGLPEDLNNAGFYAIPADEADYTKEWKNPELYKYLTLTANEPNSTVNLMPKKSSEGGPTLPDEVFYRTNADSDFKPYTLGTTINLVNVGDYVQFWNKDSILSQDYNSAYVKFYMTGSISASGNIQSLFNFREHAGGVCFTRLFEDCTSLTTAPELPATTLGSGCYHDMFKGCTNLTTAPELPATILAYHCYGGMFQGCTSLKTAPKLPALELENSCYSSMFSGCTSLTAAPELPATEMKVGCYKYMFSGCTSLTAAPELPAANLTDTPVYGGCYEAMFNGCTSLKTIKVGFTAWDGDEQDGAVRSWLYNVAESGTFYKPSALPEEFGSSRIPEGWTVVNID